MYPTSASVVGKTFHTGDFALQLCRGGAHGAPYWCLQIDLSAAELNCYSCPAGTEFGHVGCYVCSSVCPSVRKKWFNLLQVKFGGGLAMFAVHRAAVSLLLIFHTR